MVIEKFRMSRNSVNEMEGYSLEDYFGDAMDDWDPDDVAAATTMWSTDTNTEWAGDDSDSFERSLSLHTACVHPRPGHPTVQGAPQAAPGTDSASPCAITAASAQGTQIGPQATQT